MTAASASPPARRWRDQPWWPWARRVATWVFLAVVAWLIVVNARAIDWHDVMRSMVALPTSSLLLAFALTIVGQVVYTVFDLLGRRMTGHRLGTPTTMGVAFICYAFNLNLGSLVGSVALRYRLYRRLGLDNDTTTRIIGFSFVTNWMGYCAIAGFAFCFGSVDLPPGWHLQGAGLRVVGVLLMGVAVAYLVVCLRFGERVWHIRGHELATPSWRMGLLQIVVACCNWSLMGAVIWVLMPARTGYLQVLAVLLVAAIAGLISHVPAGLGVLEAVFLALLGGAVPQGPLLGALLAYRAIYYLIPLAVAVVLYAVTELRARRLRQQPA